MSLYSTGVVSRGRAPDAPLPPGLAPTASAARANPLCGDDITVDVAFADGAIRGVGYRLHGCAYVRASASLLAEQVGGLTPEQTLALAGALTRAVHSLARLPAGFEDLACVHLLPARRRCALLPWEALAAALDGVER